MLKTVKDACELHESTLEYQVAGGVENLAQVIGAADQGRGFFEKSYMTAGMEDLLAQGLLRLSGQSDQALFELGPGHGRRQDAFDGSPRAFGPASLPKVPSAAPGCTGPPG